MIVRRLLWATLCHVAAIEPPGVGDPLKSSHVADRWEKGGWVSLEEGGWISLGKGGWVSLKEGRVGRAELTSTTRFRRYSARFPF